MQNRVLSRALYEAYRTLLPRDRHPVACLFLSLPAREVDVNVHPAKLEVRFRQEARLYDRLRRLFQRLLDSVAGSPVLRLRRWCLAPGALAVPGRAVPMLWSAPTTTPCTPGRNPAPGWPTPTLPRS